MLSFRVVSGVVGFGAALWVGVAAAAPPPAPEVAPQAVADDSSPIRLSNRHIGMSREKLAALGLVAREEPAPETPAPAAGFTSCVETSVRSGKGLQESVRVCRSVFMN